MSERYFATLAAALTLLTSCSQERIGQLINGKRHAPEIVDVVESRNADLSLLKIYLDLDSNGVTIRIYNIPSDADLFCGIDEHEPAPCHHGDRFDRPSPGEHRITVTAKRSGNIIDSAIAKFTISPGINEVDTIGSGDHSHPLALIVSNADFVNGTPIPVTRPLTINFAFPQMPPCESPVLRCAMDSTSGIWSLCDVKERRRIIPTVLMANGAQTLFAQASCGDLSGPLLRIQWYGVPENYEALMARIDRDSADQRIVSLVREPDCAGNAVIWECRVKDSPSSWEACASGGRMDNLNASRYDSLRAVCGSQRGPALKL